MYGAQTRNLLHEYNTLFENDVEMYGAQTTLRKVMDLTPFENDVEMYGAQTIPTSSDIHQ